MFSRDLQATSYDDWMSENEVYPVYPQLAKSFREAKKNTVMIHRIASRIEKDPVIRATSGVFRPHATSGKLT